MYKCCIFDLDGTLLNTIYAIQRSVNLTLEPMGFSPITVEDSRKFVGDGYKKLLERSLIALGDTELARYEEALERYPDIFEDCCMYRVEPYEGILELMEYLKQHGIKLAVFSNKPHARALDNVEGVFGKGYFDWISGERESEGIRRKPAPDGVYAAVRDLGVELNQCLYFGDTNTDMRTGISAGVDTVGVTWGFRDRAELEEFKPRYVIDRPQDIIPVIEKAREL